MDEVTSITGDAGALAAAISSVFTELEFEQVEAGEPPGGTIHRGRFGDMSFVRSITHGRAHRVIRSEAMIQSSSHNSFFIGLLLEGRSTFKQGLGEVLLTPGDIAVVDTTQEYVIDVSRDVHLLTLVVPRHRLEGRLPYRLDSTARRLDGTTGVGRVASSLLVTALEELSRLREPEAIRIANHMLDLTSLALDSNAGSSWQPLPPSSPLRRVQSFIDNCLDDDALTPEMIARSHSISVRYLNKLFEREGTSTARWIRERRLERCRLDIETSHAARSISDICLSHGFRDISSFNRAFKAYFGCSPRALRNSR